MQEGKAVQSDSIVKLDHYAFSGLDASLVGAMKSVADYYRLPVTAARIYGMTGLAFLHVLNANMDEPNGGPPEPEVFRLARHIGVDIAGLHAYAEGEAFRRLQAEAWTQAKRAIGAGQPVFAKNIDIGNQTSIVYAHDDRGYCTYTWHTGYEHSEDVIPWDRLGLSLCPCVHCVTDRRSFGTDADRASGLVSLHWAKPIQAADETASLTEALAFVIRLNDGGSYESFGQTYFVGARAYAHWLAALESGRLDKYYFSLFVEILSEARSHAVLFLTEMKGKRAGAQQEPLDDLVRVYSEISEKFNVLKHAYPYTEPREFEVRHHEQCAGRLREIMELEAAALRMLREWHALLRRSVEPRAD